MVGDAIISTFFGSEEYSHAEAHFGDKKYSDMLSYDYPEETLSRYPNQEVFITVTRGMLGAASSYILRSTYLEPSSPFLDVDFLNTCMSIPFKYRCHHRLYIRWINKKYPAAAQFGWESIFGAKPRVNYRFRYNVRRVFSKAWRVLTRRETHTMNPLTTWMRENPDVRAYYDKRVEALDALPLPETLKADLRLLYKRGSAIEKSMVVSVVAAYEIYVK